MAEVLIKYFSSVFTTEDINSPPVPVTKFEGDKSDHLGQLFVTLEMIAKKIKKMINHLELVGYHQNMEIVKQISTPLVKVYDFSLQDGIVLSLGKKQNTFRCYIKRDRGKKLQTSELNIKALETLIRDHMVELLVKHQLINTSQHRFLKSKVMSNQSLMFFWKKIQSR